MESEVPFPHPGEILLEEFLKPAGVSVRKLACHLRVPVRHIEQIIRGDRHITAQMDLHAAMVDFKKLLENA